MPFAAAPPWRLLIAIALPLLLVWAVQTWELRPLHGPAPLRLKQAHALRSEAQEPPPALASAPLQQLPWRSAGGGAIWLDFPLPPPQRIEPQQLLISFRSEITVYIDGSLLAQLGAPKSWYLIA